MKRHKISWPSVDPEAMKPLIKPARLAHERQVFPMCQS